MRAVDVPAMADQSHREEMSAAIRAQRARHAVPRTIAPEPVAEPTAVAEPIVEPIAEPAPERPTLLRRLFGR